jgi:hypothetical protein
MIHQTKISKMSRKNKNSKRSDNFSENLCQQAGRLYHTLKYPKYQDKVINWETRFITSIDKKVTATAYYVE